VDDCFQTSEPEEGFFKIADDVRRAARGESLLRWSLPVFVEPVEEFFFLKVESSEQLEEESLPG